MLEALHLRDWTPLDDIAFLVFFLLRWLLTSHWMHSVFRILAPRSDLGSKEHVQSIVRAQRLSPVYVFKYQISRGNLGEAELVEPSVQDI